MNNTIEVFKNNNIYFNLKLDVSQSMELKEFLSCYTENYMWSPKFKSKMWNGKVSFFSVRDQTIPIGLLPYLYTFAEKFKYKVILKFDVSTMVNDLTDEDMKEMYDTISKGTEYYPRDYQQVAIQKSLTNKRGVLEYATGSGKSLIIYYIIMFLLNQDKEVLLIVPNVSLVEQMFSDFKDYGWNTADEFCNKLYSKQIIMKGKPVLISTWQSVYKRSSDFFNRFDAIIIDETHCAGSSLSIQNLLKKCKNAEYRLGFTGTLPKQDVSKYNIFGYIGSNLSSLKTIDLIDKGLLSNLKIANILLQYPDEVVDEVRRAKSYQYEIDTIYDYEKRNMALDFVVDNVDDNDNVLVLVNRIDKHLKGVQSHLEKRYPNKKLYIIYGATPAKERERIRNKMDTEKGAILLSTYQTLSTGINIKELHHLVFFASYKSRIKILQSIGRILRLSKNKNKVIAWDIVDDFSYKSRTGKIYYNHVYKHWQERLDYYKEQGYNNVTKLLNIF